MDVDRCEFVIEILPTETLAPTHLKAPFQAFSIKKYVDLDFIPEFRKSIQKLESLV